MLTFFKKSFHKQKNTLHLQPQRDGIIAQLVEQRTENPCVAGSIPADTTRKASYLKIRGFFIKWVSVSVSVMGSSWIKLIRINNFFIVFI
jgi:hypothetical protein